MPIFIRIWLLFTVILICGGVLMVHQFQEQVKPNTRKVMEDILADNANVISALVAKDVANGQVKSKAFNERMQTVLEREISGKIWSIDKTAVQLRMYITDANGVVMYDSLGKFVGEDFSQWRDVYLTLRGKYGARSSLDPTNPKTSMSVMHVAAPIVYKGELIGVVSLGKPSASIQPFIDNAEKEVWNFAVWYLFIGWIACGLMSWWLSHNINQVRRFALALAPTSQQPRFWLSKELNDLTKAIANMRTQLEDQAYVEQYVSTLTHELKSPLAGIRAGAELLQEPLPLEDQQHFADNIVAQADKLHSLIQRMLLMMRLEKSGNTTKQEPIDVPSLLDEVIAQRQSMSSSKHVDIALSGELNPKLQGDVFWLQQAIGNVLDNALDFCEVGSTIKVWGEKIGPDWMLYISNQGPQVDAFALEKVFDRYFSLARSSGNRGSGIGLTMVQEVMQRHNGHARLFNIKDGVCVSLRFHTVPA